MPVKKRTSKHRDHVVTAAAVDAYRAGDWNGLHRALALRPWHPSPLDAVGDPPAYLAGVQRDWWNMAVELRTELDHAAAAAGGAKATLG